VRELDSFDLLDVPDDPGALGALGLDDPGLAGERHLAMLEGHPANLADRLLLDGGDRDDDPRQDRHVGGVSEIDVLGGIHATWFVSGCAIPLFWAG